jgi:hypothetical protein
MAKIVPDHVVRHGIFTRRDFCLGLPAAIASKPKISLRVSVRRLSNSWSIRPDRN